MLFLARFQGDISPILVDAATPDRALERIAEETDDVPAELHPVPAQSLMCEVRFADPEGQEAEGNPGNATMTEIALDPMGDFAEWLSETDDQPLAEGDELAALNGGR
jgi:hypothetical protein